MNNYFFGSLKWGIIFPIPFDYLNIFWEPGIYLHICNKKEKLKEI
jgi:hypothetical protein